MNNQMLESDEVLCEPWDENGAAEEYEGYPLGEYDLTFSPSDLNLKTLIEYIEKGTIKIPAFQRNYVWDIKRASKLIESLMIGLPVPQIFLFEESRKEFLVIDGQQRLMSIYYFFKERFPREEMRGELRRIHDESGFIPDEILHEDRYFIKFKLQLPQKLPNQRNRLSGLQYSDLGPDRQMAFDFRTIRNIIVWQGVPKDAESVKFEIFSRLNSGGTGLAAQEIRLMVYGSEFYSMLLKINLDKGWRRLLDVDRPDLHRKDLEFLLRSFAMLINGEQFAPPMATFLNSFSKEAREYSGERVSYLESLFGSFLKCCSALEPVSFQGATGRFSVALFEAVFTAVCEQAYVHEGLVTGRISHESVMRLKSDDLFRSVSEKSAKDTSNVRSRLQRAKEMIRVSQ